MAVIWVLTGAKTGDNAQVLRAAEAMDLPYEVKHVAVRPEFETAKPPVTASLDHLDLKASDPLQTPWPDLVITIGRRLSSVALWIKQQSMHKTRIALFNAPKGEASAFDLLVVPAYYNMPDSSRLCRIGLPLIAIDQPRITDAFDQFSATLGALAKPLHVLLLGGDMGAQKLDPAFAASIIAKMRGSFAASGSIYASTSRRTSNAAIGAVERNLKPGDHLYRWSPDTENNPYLGLLAHGDTFTVTSDSLSMMTEVARLGKPLAIAEPPLQHSPLLWLRDRIGLKPARDLGKAADHLCAGGFAVRLGEPLKKPSKPPKDDTLRVAERLRQLASGSD